MVTDSKFEEALNKYYVDLQSYIEAYPDWASDRFLSMAFDSCHDEFSTIMLLMD